MTLYHYTWAPRVLLILSSGTIRPSQVGTPFVWLSSNPVNELTASGQNAGVGFARGDMPLDPVGGYRQMRFSVLPAGAVPFSDMRLPYVERKTLVATGLRKGGRPKEWFGTPHAIQLEDCVFEGRFADKWEPVEPAAVKAVFADVDVGFVDGRLAIQGR